MIVFFLIFNFDVFILINTFLFRFSWRGSTPRTPSFNYSGSTTWLYCSTWIRLSCRCRCVGVFVRITWNWLWTNRWCIVWGASVRRNTRFWRLFFFASPVAFCLGRWRWLILLIVHSTVIRPIRRVYFVCGTLTQTSRTIIILRRTAIRRNSWCGRSTVGSWTIPSITLTSTFKTCLAWCWASAGIELLSILVGFCSFLHELLVGV